MDTVLTPSNITFAVGIIGMAFTIWGKVQKPQIKANQDSIKLEDRVGVLEKGIVEIREKHIAGVESDLKNLNITLQDLSRTVVKLGTIIDERIPRVTNN